MHPGLCGSPPPSRPRPSRCRVRVRRRPRTRSRGAPTPPNYSRRVARPQRATAQAPPSPRTSREYRAWACRAPRATWPPAWFRPIESLRSGPTTTRFRSWLRLLLSALLLFALFDQGMIAWDGGEVARALRSAHSVFLCPDHRRTKNREPKARNSFDPRRPLCYLRAREEQHEARFERRIRHFG